MDGEASSIGSRTPSEQTEHQLRLENERLRDELKSLRDSLREPEEIIRAIRHGEVDALVVNDLRGERIYSLRSADVLYRGMIEEMKEGAVALDPSGLILYCNRYFASLLGVDRRDLVGASLLSYVPGESRGFFAALQGLPEAATARHDAVLRSAAGEPVPVHLTMNRIVLEDGGVFCLIVTDLTERRHRDQLLVESRRKDEFLAMLAHELRNPIAPIRSAAQALRLVGPADQKVRWAVDLIDRQVSQLGRLVDDLLDVSRITRGKIRLDLLPLDLATVISRAVETVRPSIDARGQVLTVEVPPGRHRVRGDGVRLAQVIANLLHNAAKFTSEGGHISLGLEVTEREARVVVRDDGIGIPADMLAEIFDLFTQVDATLERAQGGLGIGLTLVRNLVERHGGRVEALSEGTGRGSTFVVTLPRLPEGAPEAATAQAAPGHSNRETVGRRILVVDDNVDAAESLMVLLEAMGHEVRMLTDGKRVVDEARAFHPDLILLDIGLPDVSGYDLAAALRQSPELAGVCLVALTGYGQEEHRRRSVQSGFDHHWVKPLDAALLETVLTSLPPRAAMATRAESRD